MHKHITNKHDKIMSMGVSTIICEDGKFNDFCQSSMRTYKYKILRNKTCHKIKNHKEVIAEILKYIN
jgi:hypothetical protein